MTATKQSTDPLPIARTAIDDDEEATDALLRAARRAHVDLDDADPQLYDQIDAGALDGLVAHHRGSEANGEFALTVDLWDRTFVVHADAVEVFP